MRFSMIALIVMLLNSGCQTAPATVSPCGPDDFVKVPAGGTISGVTIPLVGVSPVVIKTTQAGQWTSLNCWDRLEKSK